MRASRSAYVYYAHLHMLAIVLQLTAMMMMMRSRDLSPVCECVLLTCVRAGGFGRCMRACARLAFGVVCVCVRGVGNYYVRHSREPSVLVCREFDVEYTHSHTHTRTN